MPADSGLSAGQLDRRTATAAVGRGGTTQQQRTAMQSAGADCQQGGKAEAVSKSGRGRRWGEGGDATERCAQSRGGRG